MNTIAIRSPTSAALRGQGGATAPARGGGVRPAPSSQRARGRQPPGAGWRHIKHPVTRWHICVKFHFLPYCAAASLRHSAGLHARCRTQLSRTPRMQAAGPQLPTLRRQLVKYSRQARDDGLQCAKVGVVRDSAPAPRRRRRRPTAGRTQSALFLHYKE